MGMGKYEVAPTGSTELTKTNYSEVNKTMLVLRHAELVLNIVSATN